MMALLSAGDHAEKEVFDNIFAESPLPILLSLSRSLQENSCR
jgi:hypothetical protein